MTTNLPKPMEALKKLLADAPARINGAATIAELDVCENDLIGRTSPIAAARRTLGQINDDAERAATGKRSTTWPARSMR